MTQCEFITIWQVTGDKDQTEGRGGTYVVGYTKTEKEAQELARGKGVMGSDGEVHLKQAIKFDHGAIYEIGERCDEQWAKMERKAAALAKLTPEDREALGLK